MEPIEAARILALGILAAINWTFALKVIWYPYD